MMHMHVASAGICYPVRTAVQEYSRAVPTHDKAAESVQHETSLGGGIERGAAATADNLAVADWMTSFHQWIRCLYVVYAHVSVSIAASACVQVVGSRNVVVHPLSRFTSLSSIL